MTYLALVVALGIGYVIGVMQKGIHIYQDSKPKLKKNDAYNESFGVAEITEYYDETEGMNKF